MDPEVLEALRRDSGLRVDCDGVFHFHARPVQNPRVQDLFMRGLSVRDDGEVVLTVGSQRAYVKCDTVARFVDGIRVAEDELQLRLRGGSASSGRQPRLAFGPNDRVYVWERPGVPPAILTRGAHHQLVDLLEPDGEGGATLTLGPGGERIQVETLAVAPAPGERR